MKPMSNPESAPEGAAPFVPPNPLATIPQLSRAAQKCRGCDLYKNATQAVFGEGIQTARIMLIGEQPGDQEDIQGRPFVGPAGHLLDRALGEAQIDRAGVYVTNAVKHFKWLPAPRGKRRLHAKPSPREVDACRPWLAREIELVKPRVVVCMGATAGQALFGRAFRLGETRGKNLRDTSWAPIVMATFHPSAILRMPDREVAEQQYQEFVKDLRRAKKLGASAKTG
jgi:DNA polymerase